MKPLKNFAYCFKDEAGELVPVTYGSSSGYSSVLIPPDEYRRLVIKFPECKDNLYLIVDGTEFRLDKAPQLLDLGD
ncbi:hypothetical protein [Lacticaseibacillus zhaodongensis]|uniref:hypothetical protein n=1 Tax=Lacticaseibacillus zhaodongensis TaxID=2668065 RepID=UPI0012D2B79C|nr:hypothetical protein [Lacticaseibacillus zhaodongensis]